VEVARVDETPLSVVQGQTYTMEVTYEGPEQPPVARSLAGYRARMTVRPANKLTSPLLFDLDSDGNGLSIEPLDTLGAVRTGVIAVRISAQLTELMTKTSYWYDLFVINIADPSEALRLVHGTMTVDQSVTSVAVAVVTP
jgi:hypothetical protein